MSKIGYYKFGKTPAYMVYVSDCGTYAIPPELQAVRVAAGPRLQKRQRAAEIDLRGRQREWAKAMDRRVIEGLGL